MDAHSKWLDIVIVPAVTLTVTIEKLRAIFATHGFAARNVMYNGTVFVNDVFRCFLYANGIAHTQTTSYHPASNDLVEHAVQNFKQGIKRLECGTPETDCLGSY